MHRDLEVAAERLHIELANLRNASQRSVEALNRADGWIRARIDDAHTHNMDVVVLGSYAREEATVESDFDYLVVAHGVPSKITITRDLLKTVDDFIEKYLVDPDDPTKKRRPGGTGLFGRIAVAADLTERIGLEQDTNISHSRRVLIMQESHSILNPNLRDDLLRAALERYFYDYIEHRNAYKEGVPRFLLNDLLRYWFTLAVDYQAKRWENAQKWGLRYLKLIISRKLSHFGSLISLLHCDMATPEYFLEQFNKPPLARIAQLCGQDGFDNEAVGTVLEVADAFSGFLANDDMRAMAEGIEDLAPDVHPVEFKAMEDNAKRLQVAVEKLLFESPLRERAQKYLGL